MKRKDLEKLLKKNNWWLLRHGTNHDVWTNGLVNETIPRHSELKEHLVEAIIKRHNLK